MVYRSNRYGRFEACSNYPTCKYIKKPESTDSQVKIKCPECETGYLIQRVKKVGSKSGQKFYGCSNYPTCKFTISKLSDLKNTK